jgi:hypothetical protein
MRTRKRLASLVAIVLMLAFTAGSAQADPYQVF